MDKNAEEIGQVSNEKTTEFMNSFIIFWSNFISPYPTYKLRITSSTTNVATCSDFFKMNLSLHLSLVAHQAGAY